MLCVIRADSHRRCVLSLANGSQTFERFCIIMMDHQARSVRDLFARLPFRPTAAFPRYTRQDCDDGRLHSTPRLACDVAAIDLVQWPSHVGSSLRNQPAGPSRIMLANQPTHSQFNAGYRSASLKPVPNSIVSKTAAAAGSPKFDRCDQNSKIGN